MGLQSSKLPLYATGTSQKIFFRKKRLSIAYKSKYRHIFIIRFDYFLCPTWAHKVFLGWGRGGGEKGGMVCRFRVFC